ncbi:MAG: biopolymer transporter ExbD [Oligoflexia bacterium]|nr:biopolymer transporter ExbD [Oligoflexia bacterium]
MAGGSFNSQDEDQLITDINVTPLVDVVLVLLIIFMVTTPMIMKPSINVNLPKAASADQASPGELQVTISKDGKIFANGNQVGEDGLKAVATELVTANAETQAMISADKDTPHGIVISAIDIIKGAGIKRFAINIEKKNK